MLGDGLSSVYICTLASILMTSLWSCKKLGITFNTLHILIISFANSTSKILPMDDVKVLHNDC